MTLPLFEEYTHDLTEIEINEIAPLLLWKIEKQCQGKENAITGGKMMHDLIQKEYKTDCIRIRKMIAHIQINNYICCLMASSKGYYISSDIEELETYLNSLKGREYKIRLKRLAIEKQVEQFKLNSK